MTTGRVGSTGFFVRQNSYRALATKSGRKAHLRSRNNKDFGTRYAEITAALEPLHDETVIDGDVVAMDAAGRPPFNALQNLGAVNVTIVYYAFDVLILPGLSGASCCGSMSCRNWTIR